MISLIIPVAALVTPLAPCGQAPAAPETVQKTDANRPISVAEHNYIIENLARSVESVRHMTESYFSKEGKPQVDEGKQYIQILEREIVRNDVPLDGLSEEQRAFLTTERKIYRETLDFLRQSEPANHKGMFLEMLEKLNAHRKTATPEVKRLFGDEPFFTDLANAVEIDPRLRSIAAALHAQTGDAEQRQKKALEDLTQLAAHIRSFKK